MKVSTPLGDYDYRVRHVAVRHGQLEVDGNLGEWETTMTVERSDLLDLAKRAVPALAAVGALAVLVIRGSRLL